MAAAALDRWLRVFYVFLRLYPCCICGFLNIEELNEMKYGIQTLPDPVVLGQVRLELLVRQCVVVCGIFNTSCYDLDRGGRNLYMNLI